MVSGIENGGFDEVAEFGDGSVIWEILSENDDGVVTILAREFDDGDIGIGGPDFAVPVPANLVVDLGLARKAARQALTPVIGGIGSDFGWWLVEHGVSDAAPERFREVFVVKIKFKKFGKVASAGFEAEVTGVLEVEVVDEFLDAARTGGVATHGIGAAIVGFADGEVETLTEGIVVGAIVSRGSKVIIEGFVPGGDLAVAVVNVEKLIDRGDVKNAVRLIAGGDVTMVEVIDHESNLAVGGSDPGINNGLKIDEAGSFGISGMIGVGRSTAVIVRMCGVVIRSP